MEVLKLKSIRLSESSLANAENIVKKTEYLSTSDVLRVAIWVGLKLIKPRVIHEFLQMMWQEEYNGADYCAADVLRAAGEKLENIKSLE